MHYIYYIVSKRPQTSPPREFTIETYFLLFHLITIVVIHKIYKNTTIDIRYYVKKYRAAEKRSPDQ